METKIDRWKLYVEKKEQQAERAREIAWNAPRVRESSDLSIRITNFYYSGLHKSDPAFQKLDEIEKFYKEHLHIPSPFDNITTPVLLTCLKRIRNSIYNRSMNEREYEHIINSTVEDFIIELVPLHKHRIQHLRSQSLQKP